VLTEAQHQSRVILLHIMTDSGPLSTLTYLYVIEYCYECLCPDLFICTTAGIAAHCQWLARSLWIHIAHSSKICRLLLSRSKVGII